MEPLKRMRANPSPQNPPDLPDLIHLSGPECEDAILVSNAINFNGEDVILVSDVVCVDMPPSPLEHTPTELPDDPSVLEVPSRTTPSQQVPPPPPPQKPVSWPPWHTTPPTCPPPPVKPPCTTAPWPPPPPPPPARANPAWPLWKKALAPHPALLPKLQWSLPLALATLLRNPPPQTTTPRQELVHSHPLRSTQPGVAPSVLFAASVLEDDIKI